MSILCNVVSIALSLIRRHAAHFLYPNATSSTLSLEPGSDAEVETFCATKGVQGAHVFTKADVNGENARPTYRTLRAVAGLGNVKWNFMGRFVVDKEGNIVLPPTDEAAFDTVKSLV